VNSRRPRIVALGGGHGLSATLGALALLDAEVTGVVGVLDDGGSSGRLRNHLQIPPPGDLRMAIAALIPPGDSGDLWRRVLQHRFDGTVDVGGHAVGNLVIAALWSETGDLVAGLDALGAAVQSRGRVLPNCVEPVNLVAEIKETGNSASRIVRGQSAISATRGNVVSLMLEPDQPRSCPEAVRAIEVADVLVFGPGSWYTSVLPHLLVPQIKEAIRTSQARRVLVLNLQPERGETEGFAPHTHLESWRAVAGDVSLDYVIADRASASDGARLETNVALMGGVVRLADVADSGVHNCRKLADEFTALLSSLEVNASSVSR
jgi:uncharacterized cofD-like protein